MHPPPIAERSYIEFPKSADLALTEVIDDNSKLEQRIALLENTIKTLENSNDKKQDIRNKNRTLLNTKVCPPDWGSIILDIERPAVEAIFSPATDAAENRIVKIKIQLKIVERIRIKAMAQQIVWDDDWT